MRDKLNTRNLELVREFAKEYKNPTSDTSFSAGELAIAALHRDLPQLNDSDLQALMLFAYHQTWYKILRAGLDNDITLELLNGLEFMFQDPTLAYYVVSLLNIIPLLIESEPSDYEKWMENGGKDA